VAEIDTRISDVLEMTVERAQVKSASVPIRDVLRRMPDKALDGILRDTGCPQRIKERMPEGVKHLLS
jgi:hypothetical protein